MRILIIRHADPEYNGDTLTEHGWKEAKALGKYFGGQKDEGKGKLTKIFTSPMGRAKDTAKCTEAATGLKANVQEWTRELTYWPRMELEWGGVSDAGKGAGKGGEGGLAVWDVPGEVVRAISDVTVVNEFDLVAPISNVEQRYKELCASSDSFLADLGYSREPDGTYTILKRNRDVRAFRICSFCAALVCSLSSVCVLMILRSCSPLPIPQTIAVFCHGGFGLTWLARLLGMPVSQVWSSFYMPPSSVTTVLFDERSLDKAVPRALSVGETGHLYAAGLKTAVSKYEKPNVFSGEPRPSGVKANFF